ncbi:pyridine nucleotide-disulfide oxidoreductase family protein [Azotobacter vinelandii CA]|uniref:Pyridine nucleotide-disulphide oxidoreductase family protein n=2 Tax=Azotobacter vinelandii TaxID=354 RepID=C1DKA1_AZOVD|nr:FAD-dependent oxidoreductase [Azotobacter vinelandii]ACO81006.1 pyridine nucleotide-disulphide oxidoreductase family protein [Azotobacter vinelandii DJ]AGK15827.1 pyridine nucleotide-disulfide oxidoreductase family protein [Azotobacter vinelandii CA]AGK22287.1 pyridine nucleotide-disulfide oxidoreductase family protein [Azotobacter vinelandii CA6]WKN21788.1 FAD-dependent oxidoreductase [Azotobacter vinelandii]SFW98515.1 NADH dehydrogenase, FAD-containing subunit [Azotobacter vinelandii]
MGDEGWEVVIDLLLIGAGHSHLGVLRRWARGRRPKGRLGLIDAAPQAWYAGRLPGLLAGRHAPQDCCIELAPLCRAADVELIVGEVCALRASTREVRLTDGRLLGAEWLSLNVGAGRLVPPRQGEDMQVLSAKPFAAFLDGWQRWRQAPEPVAILGGGPAGVELALALAGQVPALSLFSAGPLLEGRAAGLRLRALGALRRRGVWVREHCPISGIDGQLLLSAGEPVWQGSRLLLAGDAAAPAWLAHSGLACDAEGFVRVSATLQSLSQPRIFASGDCAALPGADKSAAQALHQARVLSHNLRAVLAGRALQHHRPQRQNLLLLACGDGEALLGWRGWSAGGRFCGYWREWLDRRFVRRHAASG